MTTSTQLDVFEQHETSQVHGAASTPEQRLRTSMGDNALRAERRRLVAVERAGGCTNPIRLAGSMVVTDEGTGRTVHHWDSTHDELNGAVYVPCKTRRADRCEHCARLYQGDAYRLIVDGLRGGEFVTQDVADHPALFVTFTAPSFGVVHRHATKADGKILPCHPRRGGELCPHGVDLDCKVRHDHDDPQVGQAICPDCFDYDGAATWNHFAGKLWRQTRIEIERSLARRLRTKRTDMRRTTARTEFVKVAEFQRRGLVHFHVAIRVDGPDGERAPVDYKALVDAVWWAHHKATVATVDGQRIGWGTQLDVKLITERNREKLAGYFAKYATKSADAKGQLNQRIRDERHLEFLPVNDHLARLVRAAWSLGNRHEELTAAKWAHQFGFGGHFLTKSRNAVTKDGVEWLGWSTTFKALRDRRAEHNAAQRRASWEALSDTGKLVVEAHWDFSGSGFASPQDAHLAALRRAERERQHEEGRAA